MCPECSSNYDLGRRDEKVHCQFILNHEKRIKELEIENAHLKEELSKAKRFKDGRKL